MSRLDGRARARLDGRTRGIGFRVKFKVLGVCLAWTGGLGLAWMGEPEGLYEGLGLSSRFWGSVSPGWAGSGSPGWANPRVYIYRVWG